MFQKQTELFNFFINWRLWRATLLSAVLAASVSACVPLLVGGAVVGGAVLVSDRRTSGAQLDDKGIELRGRNRVKAAIAGRTAKVNVTSYNRMVLLTGQVLTEADRLKIENAVREVPNVRHLVNEITIGSLATRPTRDALITTRVRTALLGTKNVRSGAVKVTTENATVYLMGLVNANESARAASIASRVVGVKKVVKVFELTNAPVPHPIGVPDKTGQTGRSVNSISTPPAVNIYEPAVPVQPTSMQPVPAPAVVQPQAAPIGVTTSP